MTKGRKHNGHDLATATFWQIEEIIGSYRQKVECRTNQINSMNRSRGVSLVLVVRER